MCRSSAASTVGPEWTKRDGAGPSRKDGRKLTQTLKNTQQTFAQDALFLTLAWPKLGVSDTSFKLSQIFLIHLSITPATTAVHLIGPCLRPMPYLGLSC